MPARSTPLVLGFLFAACATSLAGAEPRTAPTKVTVNSDQVLEVNGRKVFPIGFTMPPAPDAKAPNGKMGIEELADAGATFMRTGPSGSGGWNDKYIAVEQQYQDAAAKYGMLCLPWLKELSEIDPKHPQREQMLRKVVNLFKDHPGMGCWKGDDEPEWGRKPVEPLVNAYKLVKELDPNHPMWIVQAPRGTINSLRSYLPAMDITGVDIYPVSYPPGIHSLLPNTELSLVGDHTRIMMEVADGKMPVWLTLQIAWSGVVKEERTLRMPTYHEERFMVYQAIINGARGLIFFGGNLPQAHSDEDKKYGWNWTFWNTVLRRVIEQVGDKSPLQSALVAPEAKTKLKTAARLVGVSYATANHIEFAVREVDNEIYLLACNSGRETLRVAFDVPPEAQGTAEVMFESPRKVKVERIKREVDRPKKGTVEVGQFIDWFGPFEVHVYKLRRQ